MRERRFSVVATRQDATSARDAPNPTGHRTSERVVRLTSRYRTHSGKVAVGDRADRARQ
jgi:hypothetical protein